MRVRESGMPFEPDWDAFFDAEATVDRIFGSKLVDGDVVDFGCGYGTFTIPAALWTRGTLTALDIDPLMVELVDEKAGQLGLKTSVEWSGISSVTALASPTCPKCTP